MNGPSSLIFREIAGQDTRKRSSGANQFLIFLPSLYDIQIFELGILVWFIGNKGEARFGCVGPSASALYYLLSSVFFHFGGSWRCNVDLYSR